MFYPKYLVIQMFYPIKIFGYPNGNVLSNEKLLVIQIPEFPPQVDFLDLATSEWRQLPSLNYKIGESIFEIINW